MEAKPAKFSYSTNVTTITQNSFQLTLAEPVEGEVTVTLKKGALIMLDMTGQFGNKTPETSYTNNEFSQNITLTKAQNLTSDIHCDATYFVQNDFNVQFAVFSGTTGTESANILSFDSSKISINKGETSLPFEVAKLNPNIEIAGKTYNGVSLILSELVAGTYTVNLEEGAFVLADGKISAATSFDVVIKGESLTNLYWPANGTGYVQKYTDPTQVGRVMFAFSTTDPATSTHLANIKEIKDTKGIDVKKEDGSYFQDVRFYGISDTYMITVGENTARALILNFGSELPNGVYTLVIDKGSLVFIDGTPNAPFEAKFVWGDARPTYDAPTFDHAAGAYPVNTPIVITAGEGGFLKYRFIPDYQAPAEEGEEESGEPNWIQKDLTTWSYLLEEDGTLEAITYGENGLDSPVTSAHYTIGETPVEPEKPVNKVPTFSESSGDVKANSLVSISSATGNVAYRFIADGETETPEWEMSGKGYVYFSIEKSGTLEAYSYSDNADNSEIVSAHYNVIVQWDMPTATPNTWSAVDAGTNVIVIAPEGAYLAYKIMETGGGEYSPAKEFGIDYSEFIKTDKNTYEFIVNEATSIQFYAYGEGKANSDILYGFWSIAVPKLADPTFEPYDAAGYKFVDGSTPAVVTITAPEGATVNYIVIYDPEAYNELIASGENSVEVVLDPEKGTNITIKAYSTEGNLDTDSPFVEALYIIESDSVAEIVAEFGGDAAVFTLNGMRVNNSQKLAPGVYVVVKNGKTTKVLVK